MSENTLQRIKKFIDSKGISVRVFEKNVGMSNGSFASQLKNNKTIGVDKLENILHVYPEINPEWILTGDGEMLRSKNDNCIQDNQSNNFLLYRIEQLAVENNNLKKEIQALKTQKKYHNTIVPDIAAEPELIQHRATKNK